jgi:hypothetical protein
MTFASCLATDVEKRRSLPATGWFPIPIIPAGPDAMGVETEAETKHVPAVGGSVTAAA